MTKYIIITPVRDEEKYIEKTIFSVLSQTVKPIKWIIVNDGSTDNTGIIINNYAKNYPWIITIHRPDRGYRKAGGGVIGAFNDGYKHVDFDNWDFIVKLDGDLSFSANYFELCFRKFQEDSKLGIGGGEVYNEINGNLEVERNPIFHVRGATKIYRRECWQEIEPLVKAPGWDTLDEVKANMLNWKTQRFIDIKLIQNKNTGKADGHWANCYKNGKANYNSGYHPLFMILKCIRRITQKPFLLPSVALFCGFVSGYIRKNPREIENDLMTYIRKEQVKRIIGKNTIWK